MNIKDKKEYANNIKSAIRVLGKKNLSLIIHDLSFPALVNGDIGAGSPYSQEAKNFIDFLDIHGFNSIQLGPSGKTKSIDPSPYISTLFSNNPLFIDIKQLSQKQYGYILKQSRLDQLIRDNTSKDNRIDHNYIFDNYYSLLKEAYTGFEDRLNNKSLNSDEAKVIDQLNMEFKAFQKENDWWLYKDSLYEALSAENNNDYWPLWTNNIDKNIFTYIESRDNNLVDQANIRIKQIKAKYRSIIEEYEFIQFIVYKQRLSMKGFTEKLNFKLIADSQVAFSDRDIWANQTIFLEHYFMGAPPDYFSDSGQAWGFPVLDPDKIFNSRGELGKAGLFLKNKFLKIFKENDGVRIDHIIGLIDSWVYKSNDENDARIGGGRLYSSPDIEELKRYSYIAVDDLNHDYINEYGNENRVKSLTDEQIKKYSQIIEGVVIESAKEAGKGDDFILVCEDLGSITNPVVAVLERLKLSGIRVTHFVEPNNENHIYRGVNIKPIHWIVMGTHDNDSTLNWINTLNDEDKYSHIRYLVRDVYPYFSGEEAENAIRYALSNNTEFFKLKVAELFISPAENIQIFFTDFFGMSERYNMPATSGEQNWSLRLPSFYEKMYYESQLPIGYGINLPEVLVMAFEARGTTFVNEHNILISKLREYANTLKS